MSAESRRLLADGALQARYGDPESVHAPEIAAHLHTSFETNSPAQHAGAGSKQSSGSGSPTSIHFDDRLNDETSTISNPLLYFASEDVVLFNPTDRHRPESFRALEKRLSEQLAEEEGEQPLETVETDQQQQQQQQQEAARKLRFKWPWKLLAPGASARSVRFGVLLLVSLLPFGGHFVKNCFSSLQVYFLADKKLHFSSVKYGTLMSAQSFPNVFMPFIGGLVLDSKGHRVGLTTFLLIALAGHISFTLSMGAANYTLAVAGEVLYGLGSGTIVVAQRAVVSKFFYDKELTFALGVTVAVACFAKTLAKASVAPVAESFGGYMSALWFAAGLQCLSLLAGVAYVRVSDSAAHRAGVCDDDVGHVLLTPSAVALTLRRSTFAFWALVVLHTLFMCIYHLFANFSGHYLVENYSLTAVQAGLVSSLMPLVVVIVAPVAGFILDKVGGQLYVLLTCSVVTVIAYVLLVQERWNAGGCIVLLAACESFVPTILLSALPLSVDRSIYGAAFGFSEITQAISLLVGNVYMGYSRDRTSSYTHGIYIIIMLSCVCILLTLCLLVWDSKHGNRLNRPRARYGYRSLPT